jgi:4a-hydroxytetrahydrobiopterin dehydratase
MTRLTGQQIADEGLRGWAYLFGGLYTRIDTPDFTTGLSVVAAIGRVAEDMDQHPDLDLRRGHVDVRVPGHDRRGVTERDVRLARAIGSVAAEAGLRTAAGNLSLLRLALDTPAYESVLPFWAAVLAMEQPAGSGFDNLLGDPRDGLPDVWFQASGSEEPRQRWHPDVWVDPGEVRPRIDAALAVGGTVVSEEAAPRFWVLADPEGNQVCLCTWQDRD